MKKVLSISGGATKIAGLLGVAESLKDKGYRPEVIAGVSSGSIIAILYATGLLSQVRTEILNMNLDTIFDIKPVNSKGKFTLRALWRLIQGKDSLGRMGNLEKLIRKYITTSVWGRFLHNENAPDVIVMAVDFLSGSRKTWNLKGLDYETAIKVIMASCSIPIMTPPVVIDNTPYYDGGLRDHNPSPKVIEIYGPHLDIVSIYSRPEDYRVLDGYPVSRMIPIMSRTIEILNIEVSKGDEDYTKLISQMIGTDNQYIYLPPIMQHLYDTDHTRLRKLYFEGYRAALQINI